MPRFCALRHHHPRIERVTEAYVEARMRWHGVLSGVLGLIVLYLAAVVRAPERYRVVLVVVGLTVLIYSTVVSSTLWNVVFGVAVLVIPFYWLWTGGEHIQKGA